MFQGNRHIVVREEVLDLNGGGEALTVLHISDIHTWFSTRVLEKLKAIISQNNPQLLLLTGDYFDFPRGALLFRDFLREAAASCPVVFIRGNHDFMYGSRVADLLLHIPNCYCVEKSVYHFTSTNGFVYHITSWEARHELNKHKGGKNILLIHNPEALQEKELGNINLVLAGHLHGGQVILFHTRTNAHFPGSLLYRFCTDRAELEQTTVIVSKGIGDTFPFRLNCPKEVVRICIR
jgi:predicted MPP superfamily phosphohydrolase